MYVHMYVHASMCVYVCWGMGYIYVHMCVCVCAGGGVICMFMWRPEAHFGCYSSETIKFMLLSFII